MIIPNCPWQAFDFSQLALLYMQEILPPTRMFKSQTAFFSPAMIYAIITETETLLSINNGACATSP